MSNTKEYNIIAVIPAHLESVRFPRKILFPFHGLPMIEHVRRRGMLAKNISKIYVATCDQEIADTIESFGGEVIMTSNQHTNGTSRVAEAVAEIECSHVILLQGDEPLLLGRHLDQFVEAILQHPAGDAWNATGPIDSPEELDRHSFVKCAVTPAQQILYCFRRSPSHSSFVEQQTYIRKILGMIAFRKEFLLQLATTPPSTIEKIEFIEQMRIIENGSKLQSIPVSPSLPSVNEPNEANLVLEYIKNNLEQSELLDLILQQEVK